MALLLAAYVAHLVLGLGGEGSGRFFSLGVYNALLFCAALGCFLRTLVVPGERAAWIVMGCALLSWTAADIYYGLALENDESAPYPSLADAGYLGLYVGIYIALVLLMRSRIANLPRSVCLLVALKALAVASVASALLLEPILDATTGSTAAIATTLAYPVADLTLLALVVVVFAICGWRPGRTWALLGAGMLMLVIVDTIYLRQVASETYSTGPLDALWPTSALLIALAAWQRPPARVLPRLEGARVQLIPSLCALAALGLLLYDHFLRLHLVAVFLTASTLLLVIVRMAMAFAENQRMLSASRSEAISDALTGLRNRRGLMSDMQGEFDAASPGDPRALLLFDLNGFKQYNDSFGHPAGDALLTRLGSRLGEAVRPWGRAYRLGGDEFCALVRPRTARLDGIVDAATAALTESGDGFDVTSAFGSVSIPGEVTSAEEALGVADGRMYAQKGGRTSSATRQTRDVLLSTLGEQQPELRDHLRDVADLALTVGRELGLSPEQLDELARAAELHDIGKVAIPDAILSKPGALDEDEWVFMRRHTLIGERILSAAPALRPVAKLVRSSHERWDGGGYPDALQGEEIELGARIVAVCDAYEAMTADRAYRPGLPQQEALAELARCAGTQFDPAVVRVFVAAMTRKDEDRSALGAALEGGGNRIEAELPAQ
ncbi:MAG TPA: diguanylate cyclase [Thermoleophilaceae bacterium]|nr:diguanylate cyclase [Thermoleophilaceae bacterium]